jgi:hypothetical protein
MRTFGKRLGMVVVLAGCVAGLSACSTDLFSRHAAIRYSPTPELDTLYQRPADMSNAWTIMDDENWRMFTQDLGRAFYTDRPSRLTREPIPH